LRTATQNSTHLHLDESGLCYNCWMDSKDARKRLETAYKLLTEETTSRQKFESIRTLIKGLNPKIDSLLDSTSRALSDVDKLQKGDFILLSSEHLPENSDQEKERKKKVLFLINTWRQLEGEVKRMKVEFENINNDNVSSYDKITSSSKIISSVKGPFGLITLGALIVVAGAALFFVSNNSTEPVQPKRTEVLPAQTSQKSEKIQVIIFNGKELPLKDLRIASGPECLIGRTQADHYHALQNGVVKALDGTLVKDLDSGGCGFGKVEETEIVEVIPY
jgi:hypothetical protein